MIGIRYLKRHSLLLGTLVIGLALGSSPALASPGGSTASQSRPTAAPQQAGQWATTWSASPVDMGNFHYTGTVRDVVFSSVGGNTVRVRLTNTFGSQPYEFGDVSIGVSDSKGNITGAIVPVT